MHKFCAMELCCLRCIYSCDIILSWTFGNILFYYSILSLALVCYHLESVS